MLQPCRGWVLPLYDGLILLVRATRFELALLVWKTNVLTVKHYTRIVLELSTRIELVSERWQRPIFPLNYESIIHLFGVTSGIRIHDGGVTILSLRPLDDSYHRPYKILILPNTLQDITLFMLPFCFDELQHEQQFRRGLVRVGPNQALLHDQPHMRQQMRLVLPEVLHYTFL